MRKPVRSTVANRKYFQGGGLAPMKPAAPEEAVGIMASSQPLVDMVAQSAGNPQGGMSPLNFNQGGINFNTDQLSRRLTPNIEVPELKQLRGSRLRRFFYGPKMERFLNTKINLPIKSPLKGIGQFFLSDENPNQEFTVQRDFPTASSSQLATLDALVQMNPNNKDEIYSLGKKIITENESDATGENLANLMKSEKLMLDKEKAEDEKFDKEAKEANQKVMPPGFPEIDPITKEEKKQSNELIKKEKAIAEQNKKGVDAILNKIGQDETGQDETGQDETGQDETGQDKKTAMDETIQNINKSAEENNKEETKKNVSDYVDEFKAAMPQFEGMTEEEKGFAIMEAGLAIMGGQSPRALQNIAEGLKPLTDKFAKNEEQKRAFNQQINIAAAKYGLERKNTDEQNALNLANELAKEDRKVLSFTVLKPFTAPDGQKYGKGDSYALTTGEFRDGALGKLPPGSVGDINAFKALEDTTQAYLALEAKRIEEAGGKGLTGKTFTADRDKYLGHVEKVQSSLASRVILGDAAKILTEGNIETGYGWVKDKINSGLNLFPGVKNIAGLKDLYTNDRKLYDAKMKIISTQMLTAILNEGTKTISDQDRERVDELVGTLGGFFSGAIGRELLEEKLLYLDNQINNDLINNSRSMRSIEATWENQKVKDSSLNPSQVFSGIKGDISVGSPTQADKTVNWTDIYDEEKGTYREGAFS